MLLQELLDGGKGKDGVAAIMMEQSPMLQDRHIALVENIYESAILRLRLYYKVSIGGGGVTNVDERRKKN